MKGRFYKRADLRRLLGMGYEEIDRLVAEDGMPAVRVEGRRRASVRFYCGDLHEWLLDGRLPAGSRLRDPEVFAEELEAASRRVMGAAE